MSAFLRVSGLACRFLIPLCSFFVLNLIGCGGGEPSDGPLAEFDLPITIRPVSPESSSAGASLADSVLADTTIAQPPSPSRIPIFLDLSSPMAGFVPIAAGAVASGNAAGGELRLVGQLVSDHLGRVYPGAPIRWRGVAQTVEPMPENPNFRRSLFTGTESRLALAVDEIVDDLRNGRAEGGAIITDLVGTGDGVGAQLVGRDLVSWLDSAERREGDFHFGLIGVKGTYWGAFHRTHCPPTGDELGCWFSERMPGWKSRLENPISVPFYVLLFGRAADRVEDVARSVLRDVGESGNDSVAVEAVWERLTALDVSVQDTITVRVYPEDDPDGRQYIFWRNEEGRYGCYRDGGVAMQADFRQSRFIPTEPLFVWEDTEASSPFEFPLGGDPLSIGIHCGAIRSLNANPDLRLEARGLMRAPENRPDWESWSTSDDHTPEHPEKTLQLFYFVNEVRTEPGYYLDPTIVLRGGQQ